MRYLLPTLMLAVMVACPKPPEEFDPAICDDGYHPCGPDSQDCCIDSTSHDFMWVIDSLGSYGSVLNDVQIVNENNIWVTGEIILPDPDSSYNGTGWEHYDAANWDGENWNIIRIAPPLYVQPLSALHYVSDTEIWFGKSTLPILYDGQTSRKFTPADDNYPGGSKIQTIWKSDLGNVFFVGFEGRITRYDGNEFVAMETGTDVDLWRLAGFPDESYLFAAGHDRDNPPGSVIIMYTKSENTWQTIYETEEAFPSDSSMGWAVALDMLDDTLFVSTIAGIWKYNYLSGESYLVPASICQFETHYEDVNAIALNDQMYFGAAFDYVHYNGS